MSKMGDMVWKIAQANPEVHEVNPNEYTHFKNFVAPGPKPEPKPVATRGNGVPYGDIETRLSRPPKRVVEGKEQHNRLNNRWVQVDGYWFPSVLESRVYLELKHRQMAGDISYLQLQPVFILQDRFRDNTGKMQRKIEYIADFIYCDNIGNVVVADAKGMETSEFSIKRKMFLKLYPQYRFELVRDEARSRKGKGARRR